MLREGIYMDLEMSLMLESNSKMIIAASKFSITKKADGAYKITGVSIVSRQ